jgi:hypothetical protein
VEVAAYGVTYTLMVAAVTAVVTLAMTLVETKREGSVCRERGSAVCRLTGRTRVVTAVSCGLWRGPVQQIVF